MAQGQKQFGQLRALETGKTATCVSQFARLNGWYQRIRVLLITVLGCGFGLCVLNHVAQCVGAMGAAGAIPVALELRTDSVARSWVVGLGFDLLCANFLQERLD